jgi:hypothetical protein
MPRRMGRRPRRLPRVLLNTATAAWLALCVAALVMWGRSRTTHDAATYRVAPIHLYSFVSRRGGVTFARHDAWPRTPGPSGWRVESRGLNESMFTDDLPLGVLGLGVGFTFPEVDWWISVPYWLIALTTAIPPARRLKRHRKSELERRRAACLCPACGYDLRATPDRCPECGTAPPAR